MKRLSNFFYLVSQGIKSVFKNAVMSVASLLTLLSCLLVLGSFYMIIDNIGENAKMTDKLNQLVVTLDKSLTDEQIEEVKQSVAGLDNILSWTYKSKEETLEQLREKPVSPENAHIFDMELRIFCPGRLVIRGAAVVEWSDDEVILSLGAVSGAGRTVRYARTQAQTMRILADASSLEIFINHGETVLTTRYYPDPAARGVVLDGGTAQLWSINRMEIMDGISR